MANLSKRKRRERARLLEALGFRRNGQGYYGWPDEGYEVPPGGLPTPDVAVRERVLREYIPPWHAVNGKAAHLTPPEMGRALVGQVAHLIPGARVLEPCAGIGHLIEEIGQYGPAEIHAWEWEAEMIAILPILHPEITAQQANMWAAWQEHEAAFDLIIANPPFGNTCGRGTGEGLEFNGKMAEFLSIKAIVRLLKPSGTAALILPSMAFGGNRWGPMNRWLDEQGVSVTGDFRLPNVPFAFTKAAVKGFLLQKAGANGAGLALTEEVEEEKEELGLASPQALLRQLQEGSQEITAHLQQLQEMLEGTQPPLFQPEDLPGPVQLSLFGGT